MEVDDVSKLMESELGDAIPKELKPHIMTRKACYQPDAKITTATILVEASSSFSAEEDLVKTGTGQAVLYCVAK